MDPARERQIIDALTACVNGKPCLRCNHEVSHLVGETMLPVDLAPDGAVKHMPTVMVACPQCGYVMWHALGPLGLKEAPPE